MKRTLKQNRALHVWFSELARECNNAGIDQRVMVKNLRVDVTETSLKDIFRSIGFAKFGKESTADLTTKELVNCYDEMLRMLAEEGIELSFPSYQDTDGYIQSLNEESNNS